MPDYKEMYQKLFCSMTKAIAILQEAQQVTEEMYISAEPADIRVLGTVQTEDSTPDDKTPDREK